MIITFSTFNTPPHATFYKPIREIEIKIEFSMALKIETAAAPVEH